MTSLTFGLTIEEFSLRRSPPDPHHLVDFFLRFLSCHVLDLRQVALQPRPDRASGRVDEIIDIIAALIDFLLVEGSTNKLEVVEGPVLVPPDDIGRLVKLPDGSGRVETWDPVTKSWGIGRLDGADLLRGVPVSDPSA